MKSKIYKILGVALTVVLLASLMVTMAASPAMAGDRKWTKSNLPAQGADGDWFWDIEIDNMDQLGMTSDGVLVAAITRDGASFLLKSEDGGLTWSRIKKYTDVVGTTVVDFAFDPTDPDTFYVLDDTGIVWRTNDMGANFVSLTTAGLGGDTLTCIDVNWVGGNCYLFAGGGNDAYRFDEYEYGASWQSLGLATYSGDTVATVFDIRTAPDFSDSTNPMLMVLWTDGTDTYIDYKYGSGDWGSVVDQVTIDGDATGGRFNEHFPADFSSDNTSGLLEFFVGLSDDDDEAQGVYRIVGASDFQKWDDEDVVSVDFRGNVGSGTILAGTDEGTVIRCDDGVGGSWANMQVQPQGDGNVYLQMDEDYLENELAYALVDGDGQSFNRQVRDRQWLAFSLMDDEADTINDIVFGSTRYQITTNTGVSQSLWRKDENGWVRLLYKGTGEIDGVEVSRDFESDQTVFYWDNDQIYRSTNAGDRFTKQLSTVDGNITAMVAFSASTQLVATTAGTQRTTNNGTTWSSNVTTFTDGQSFAVDPTDDQHVLAGDDSGNVYESTNQGKSWKKLTKGSPTVAKGDVYVAFDPADPDRFFAAGTSDGDELAVDRWGDDGWAGIWNDPGVTTSGATGMVVTNVCGDTPAVYVSDGTASGVLRTINADAKAANVAWEQATAGTSESLMDLYLVEGSTVLYGASTSAANVWTFNDTLAAPVTGVKAVADAATASVRVSWNAMAGADEYQVQLSDREDFKEGIVDEGDPNGTSWTFQNLMPGTDYWIRVRVAMGEPLVSCWSEKVKFESFMGPAAWNPFLPPENVNPAPGAKDVDPIQPLFQWNPADDAVSYEFQLSDNAAFAGADTKVVKIPAYEWPGDLEYSKTYYWRVRSVKANGAVSEWAVGIFTTAEEPVPPTPPVVVAPPQPAPPPQYIPTTYIPEYILWTIVGIGAVLIVALIILIMKTRRVA